MKKPWVSLLRCLAVGILLAFVGRALIRQWQTIAGYEWTIHWVTFACSMILLATGFIFISFIWIYLVRVCGDKVAIRQGLWIYFCTTLGRYVPGKIWQIAGTAAVGRESGFSGTRLGTAMAFLMLANLQAGAFLSLVGVFFTATGRELHLSVQFIAGLAVMALVMALMPLGTGLMFRFLRKWLRRDLPEVRLPVKVAVIVFLLTLLHWMSEGFAHFIFIRSFYPLAWIHWFDVITVVAFATTIGFLALFAPAGLGVRDGLLVALFPFIMPQAMAVTAAIGSRLWFTVADVASVAVMLLILKLIGKFVKGSPNEPPAELEGDIRLYE